MPSHISLQWILWLRFVLDDQNHSVMLCCAVQAPPLRYNAIERRVWWAINGACIWRVEQTSDDFETESDSFASRLTPMVRFFSFSLSLCHHHQSYSQRPFLVVCYRRLIFSKQISAEYRETAIISALMLPKRGRKSILDWFIMLLWATTTKNSIRWLICIWGQRQGQIGCCYFLFCQPQDEKKYLQDALTATWLHWLAGWLMAVRLFTDKKVCWRATDIVDSSARYTNRLHSPFYGHSERSKKRHDRMMRTYTYRRIVKRTKTESRGASRKTNRNITGIWRYAYKLRDVCGFSSVGDDGCFFKEKRERRLSGQPQCRRASMASKIRRYRFSCLLDIHFFFLCYNSGRLFMCVRLLWHTHFFFWSSAVAAEGVHCLFPFLFNYRVRRLWSWLLLHLHA